MKRQNIFGFLHNLHISFEPCSMSQYKLNHNSIQKHNNPWLRKNLEVSAISLDDDTVKIDML